MYYIQCVIHVYWRLNGFCYSKNNHRSEVRCIEGQESFALVNDKSKDGGCEECISTFIGCIKKVIHGSPVAEWIK